MSDDFQKNVLGERLEDCSHQPLTGWYRDGCCNTDAADAGLHTVCAKVNIKFFETLNLYLEYIQSYISKLIQLYVVLCPYQRHVVKLK